MNSIIGAQQHLTSEQAMRVILAEAARLDQFTKSVLAEYACAALGIEDLDSVDAAWVFDLVENEYCPGARLIGQTLQSGGGELYEHPKNWKHKHWGLSGAVCHR